MPLHNVSDYEAVKLNHKLIVIQFEHLFTLH